MMYRHVCVVMGPQEAFNKCLPAEQELHKATQKKTSGKMRIKPKSTLKPVFIYHWALLPWVGQKASTSHREEYVSIPPIQHTAREAPASPGFVGTTFDHPEGTKPRKRDLSRSGRHWESSATWYRWSALPVPLGLMVTSNETMLGDSPPRRGPSKCRSIRRARASPPAGGYLAICLYASSATANMCGSMSPMFCPL